MDTTSCALCLLSILPLSFIQMFKYGVVRMDDLVRDILNWERLYLSGRLQKPVCLFSKLIISSLYTSLFCSFILLSILFIVESSNLRLYDFLLPSPSLCVYHISPRFNCKAYIWWKKWYLILDNNRINSRSWVFLNQISYNKFNMGPDSVFNNYLTYLPSLMLFVYLPCLSDSRTCG